MKSRNRILSILAFCAAVPFALSAQERKPINVVTSAVPFLRINADARSGGMGETGIATEPDANSSFKNLAKTPFNTGNSGIGLTYSPWLKKLGVDQMYLATLSAFTKLDDNQAISGSLRYFRLGDIEFTDNMGNKFGSYQPKEFSVDAGYSRKLSQQMSIAIALRYINSNLAGGASMQGVTYKAGSAVAGDISLFYKGTDETGAGWNFGAAITNLGSKIGYTTDATQKDFIPANIGIGATYTKVFDEDNKITFALDIDKLMVPTPPAMGDSMGLVNYRSKPVVESWLSSFGDAPGGFSEEMREFQFGGGLEYSYQDQFSARAGYFHEDKTKGSRQYFTLGVGLNYEMLGVNFAYIVPTGTGVNQNPLSNTMRFSLVVGL